MSGPPADEVISVLCVDDNQFVVEAIAMKLSRTKGFSWKGELSRADTLTETVVRDCPSLVLLDIDMPGRDPFEAIKDLVAHCPSTRVVVFSGHVRRDLVERAVDVGVWGYVSKNDGEDELLAVLRRVSNAEFALSPEVQRVYHP
ncbi:MAG: response regulator transcription factor [Planctomycetota bacterium]|nr:response regulator transcription factor [Planctomycetota bacterium]